MHIKTIQLYNYNELEADAQEKVITDIVKFFLEAVPYEEMSPEMKRACDKSEEMQTPWFVGSYMWEYAEAEILKIARANTYRKDGSVEN